MSTRKTSTTAYVVVAGLANLARMPRWRSYFTDDIIRLNAFFVQQVQDTLAKRFIGRLSPRMFVRVMDWLYIPGMTEHFLFRKQLVETQLEIAISEGVRQVIVLGAGLDTLTLRAGKKHPEVNFFEIDLPETQRVKMQMLKEAGYMPPPNCIYKEVDLAQTKLEATLYGDDRFNPDAPTAVVLEGVLMYLTEPEVKSLFSTMRQLFKNRLIVIFGATAASDNDGNWRVKTTNLLLRRGREETKWHCPSEMMPKFMADAGYELMKWIPYKKLQSMYRSEAELSELPEEDENYYIVAKMSRTDRDTSFRPINGTPFISIKS